MRNALVLLLTLVTCACATPPGHASMDAGVRDAAAIDAPPAADANEHVESRTLQIGPFSVVSGMEQTLCVALDLGNTTPMMLRGVRTHINDGSHHLVVSRADGTPVSTIATPCPPLSHGIGQAIFIAESREGSLAYPPYAGLPLVAHQVIGLELHMINLSRDAANIMGTVDLDLVPVTPGIRQVQILFTGDFALTLPPHQMTTATSLWPMTPGTEVLAMTTHTHQLGIDATLDVTPDPRMPGTRVVESMSWSDPPLVRFEPPLVMGPSDQVRLTCVFENTTDATVYFGTGFRQEMCFFWAYYLDPL